LGYPALILDPEGPTVEVQIFESADLPSHWPPRLDDFEGSGYQRVAVPVETADGRLEASITYSSLTRHLQPLQSRRTVALSAFSLDGRRMRSPRSQVRSRDCL
jgi:gamma-glutamylcyclotransferase (GGCT)/AIG2-like uncharacterized protein YtfP